LTDIDEKKQRFTFDESWATAFKFDDHPQAGRALALAGRWENHDGTWSTASSRSVDIVGLRNTKIYLIEVKDFRLAPAANRARWTGGGLALEVATKVRDSLATLIGGVHADDPAVWRPLARAVAAKEAPVVVVLFLETGPVPAAARRPVTLKTLGDELKRRLKWLNPLVVVTSQELMATHGTPPGVVVRNLPGAVATH
jgi:hypothetical protein